jgi:hypothetical protein
LRDQLREGSFWLDTRKLSSGVSAFFASPPSCIYDKHVQKMSIERFGSWPRLLDVAWRALDEYDRLTLNELVRMSLAGQPLPEGIWHSKSERTALAQA